MKLESLDQHELALGEHLNIKIDSRTFKTLIDGIYNDKLASVIRELCSNARDSHVSSGNADSYNLTIVEENSKAVKLILEDKGTGLTKDEAVEYLCSLNSSSKREDDTQLGFFGIGAKSPFSISSDFSYTCVKDGRKTLVEFIRIGGTTPQFVLEDLGETDEENGVTCEMNLSEEYQLPISDFIREVRRALLKGVTLYSIKPRLFLGGRELDVDWPDVLRLEDGYVVNPTSLDDLCYFRNVVAVGEGILNHSVIHRHLYNDMSLLGVFIPLYQPGELTFGEGREHIDKTPSNTETTRKKERENQQSFSDFKVTPDSDLGEVLKFIYYCCNSFSYGYTDGNKREALAYCINYIVRCAKPLLWKSHRLSIISERFILKEGSDKIVLITCSSPPYRAVAYDVDTNVVAFSKSRALLEVLKNTYRLEDCYLTPSEIPEDLYPTTSRTFRPAPTTPKPKPNTILPPRIKVDFNLVQDKLYTVKDTYIKFLNSEGRTGHIVLIPEEFVDQEGAEAYIRDVEDLGLKPRVKLFFECLNKDTYKYLSEFVNKNCNDDMKYRTILRSLEQEKIYFYDVTETKGRAFNLVFFNSIKDLPINKIRTLFTNNPFKNFSLYYNLESSLLDFIFMRNWTKEALDYFVGRHIKEGTENLIDVESLLKLHEHYGEPHDFGTFNGFLSSSTEGRDRSN